MNQSLIYLIRRLGFYFLAGWAAITLNFFIPRLMPGDPASIMECMRYGLVPLITKDTDIAFKGSIFFKSYHLGDIKTGINTANSLSKDEYIRLALKSYSASLDNYSSNYSIAIEKAFCDTIASQTK